MIIKGVSQLNKPIVVQEEVLTVPELTKRLRMRAEEAYILTSEPGCPKINVGGARGTRIIWTQFLEWMKQRSAG